MNKKVLRNLFRDAKTLEISLRVSESEFYESMIPNESMNRYTINSKVENTLKLYMFQNMYNRVKTTRLKNLSSKEIVLNSKWKDFSDKKGFIEKWIKESQEINSIRGTFSFNDFSRILKRGKILVSEDNDIKVYFKEISINLTVSQSNKKWVGKIDLLERELRKLGCYDFDRITWEDQEWNLYDHEDYRLYSNFKPKDREEVKKLYDFLEKNNIDELSEELYDLYDELF